MFPVGPHKLLVSLDCSLCSFLIDRSFQLFCTTTWVKSVDWVGRWRTFQNWSQKKRLLDLDVCFHKVSLLDFPARWPQRFSRFLEFPTKGISFFILNGFKEPIEANHTVHTACSCWPTPVFDRVDGVLFVRSLVLLTPDLQLIKVSRRFRFSFGPLQNHLSFFFFLRNRFGHQERSRECVMFFKSSLILLFLPSSGCTGRVSIWW